MRKLLVLAVAVSFVSLAAVSARAEEGSGLEISGNLTTVTGWQKANTKVTTRTLPARGGILADGLLALTTASAFGIFVDQVELDVAKGFGENIRVRADLDFTPHRVNAGGGQVGVEQAYGTVNVPAGNGVELLVGRFNSGIGLDPIDRNEMKTVSFSMVHRVVLPHNLTGARAGYNFNDTTRWEVFIVNDLGDSAPGVTTSIPSLGSNLVYSWGDQGNKSWVKLNTALGPETGTKRIWSFLGDLNGSVAVSDALRVGLEAVYRQDNQVAGVAAKNVAGQLNGTYAFSDVWDGTLRYGLVWQTNGVGPAQLAVNELFATPGLGAAGQGQNHELTLATGYKITDGAKFVLEGRIDLAKASAAGAKVGYGYGIAGMFAYSF